MRKAFDVFAQLDLPVWLVTSATTSQRGGLIATFVSQGSICPDLPRVVIGIGCHHYTWDLIEASDRFVLHLLSEAQIDWVWHFALQSGRGLDKLQGFVTEKTPSGQDRLTGVPAWLDCRVEARFSTGDRTIYLAEIVDGELTQDAPHLTVKRMVELAPPERLQEMKVLLERDQQIDAEAIIQWRQNREG